VEQRYDTVMGVIRDGRDVTEVAKTYGVSRQTVHSWLRRYEAGGIGALSDRSHRPRSAPNQMAGATDARVLELRRLHPLWGQRRLVHQLRRFDPVPSEAGVYPRRPPPAFEVPESDSSVVVLAVASSTRTLERPWPSRARRSSSLASGFLSMRLRSQECAVVAHRSLGGRRITGSRRREGPSSDRLRVVMPSNPRCFLLHQSYLSFWADCAYCCEC